MRRLRRLAAIVRGLMGRGRTEHDLDRELQSYVDLSADDKVAAGLAPEEARRLAQAELGGIEAAKERVRSGRHGWRLEELIRDARHAWRVLRRAPGFTAVVLVTLALGIGTNTAIFTLIDALMLRPLAARDARSLALLTLRPRGAAPAGGDESLSYVLIHTLDLQRDAVESVGGFSTLTLDVGRPGAVERVSGALVTGGFFDMLGLPPGAGRLLARDDDAPGAPLVGVLGDDYWARRFNRSPAAIGQSIFVNGVPVTIVGVTPRAFQGVDVGERADLLLPVSALVRVRPSMARFLDPGTEWLRALARPAAGLSRAEAAARLNARWPSIAALVAPARWTAARRQTLVESTLGFEPGGRGFTSLRATYRRPLLILQAVAGVVLLLACVNIASLFLARAETRRRELALRLAIGASRARVVRQLVVESLLISTAGAVWGIAVATASVRMFLRLFATPLSSADLDLTPTLDVLLFTTAIAVVTGVVFGIVPAVQLRYARPSSALGDGRRAGDARSRLLPALVVVQVALSCVLVGGAGLLVRTVHNLEHVDRGFTADDVFVLTLGQTVPAGLLDRLRAVPEVVAVSLATQTPLDGASWTEPLVPAGQRVPDSDSTSVIAADAAYFTTLRIPLSAGRALVPADAAGPPVAVINERYARQFFPSGNPIGRSLTGTVGGRPVQLEIVGVVRNMSLGALRDTKPPIVYLPFEQFGARAFPLPPALAIRVRHDAPGAPDAVLRVIQSAFPAGPVSMTPLDTQVRATITEERLVATLASGFGALALLLASVGLYGMLAFQVSRRAREIGIRMALGASGRGVLRMVLARGLALVGAGAVLGLPLTWLAGRAISSLLFGLTPADPVTLAAVAIVLASAAALASFLPARRASQVDPVVALRAD